MRIVVGSTYTFIPSGDQCHFSFQAHRGDRFMALHGGDCQFSYPDSQLVVFQNPHVIAHKLDPLYFPLRLMVLWNDKMPSRILAFL